MISFMDLFFGSLLSRAAAVTGFWSSGRWLWACPCDGGGVIQKKWTHVMVLGVWLGTGAPRLPLLYVTKSNPPRLSERGERPRLLLRSSWNPCYCFAKLLAYRAYRHTEHTSKFVFANSLQFWISYAWKNCSDFPTSHVMSHETLSKLLVLVKILSQIEIGERICKITKEI